ncbi:ABC transporter ATP-binding protein [Aquamicrobium segne]|uniref:ABC transporter ATP-binding protein n=1 Tax=Aquamicrobium segne TaxID=469547 RepID=A0ABW0GZ29_9HYPH
MSKKPVRMEDAFPLLKRLFFENFRPYRIRYAIALTLMAISSAATAASAWIMRDIINVLFVEEGQEYIIFYGVLVALISIIKGFSVYGQTIVLSEIGNSIVASMKSAMYQKLLLMKNDYFADSHSSKFIANMNHNANSARSALNLIATSLGRDLMTVIALVIVMIAVDPFLAIAAFIIAPPIIIGVTKILRKIKALSAQEAGFAADIIRTAMESARGIDVVKTFGLQEAMRTRMAIDLAKFEVRTNQLQRLQASTGPLMETMGGLAVGGVIMYAAWQSTSAGKTPGEFMAFLTAFLLAYEPAKRLARLQVTLQRNLVGLRMMYSFLDSGRIERDQPNAAPLNVTGGEIKFEDVVFSYEKSKSPVLKNVSIQAKRGEVVALVGPSGGGKSTMFSLLLRFISPQSGRIVIDGMDIQNSTLESLRDNIASVSQNAFLFGGTIEENIAMGRTGASPEAIVEAARAAYAYDFIKALPKGFATQIGEQGAKLSGGQRQRIAIARALLKDAPILLLDEATSALDNISERNVQLALETLMKGRTTLVVAHRLSTVAKADRIFVLEDGKIVEHGKHRELLRQGGLYATLNEFGSHTDDAQDSVAFHASAAVHSS